MRFTPLLGGFCIGELPSTTCTGGTGVGSSLSVGLAVSKLILKQDDKSSFVCLIEDGSCVKPLKPHAEHNGSLVFGPFWLNWDPPGPLNDVEAAVLASSREMSESQTAAHLPSFCEGKISIS